MTDSQKPENALIALDNLLEEALIWADVTALEVLLDEDLLLADLWVGRLTKKQLISQVRTGEVKFASMIYLEKQFLVHAQGCQLTGRILVKGIENQTEFKGLYHYTHTYRMSDRSWRLILAQYALLQPIPA